MLALPGGSRPNQDAKQIMALHNSSIVLFSVIIVTMWSGLCLHHGAAHNPWLEVDGLFLHWTDSHHVIGRSGQQPFAIPPSPQQTPMTLDPPKCIAPATTSSPRRTLLRHPVLWNELI
jgi:hypothetical protein